MVDVFYEGGLIFDEGVLEIGYDGAVVAVDAPALSMVFKRSWKDF
jgi:hypothetical protein